MIKANNLCKTYKTRTGKFYDRKYIIKEAVKNVSMQIEKGKIVGLLGINGAGKTTTIKMLTTLISPTSGEIMMDEINAVEDYFEAKRRINIITGGERNIYWRLTAKENLEYFGSLYGVDKAILEKRIEYVLKIVDLYDARDIPVEKYSKGMKQRLQIARGLINDPEYLFLDEPTLGLDVIITKHIHEYLKKLAKDEKGLLITTHYIKEAEILCDYIYIIHEGKIVAQGTPAEIKNLYTEKEKYIITLDAYDESTLDRLNKTIPNDCSISFNPDEMKLEVASTNQNFAEINDYLVQNGIVIKSLDFEKTSLEDVLIEIIERGNFNVESA